MCYLSYLHDSNVTLPRPSTHFFLTISLTVPFLLTTQLDLYPCCMMLEIAFYLNICNYKQEYPLKMYQVYSRMQIYHLVTLVLILNSLPIGMRYTA